MTAIETVMVRDRRLGLGDDHGLREALRRRSSSSASSSSSSVGGAARSRRRSRPAAWPAPGGGGPSAGSCSGGCASAAWSRAASKARWASPPRPWVVSCWPEARVTAQSTLKAVAFAADDHVGAAAVAVEILADAGGEFVGDPRSQSLADVDVFAGDLDLHEPDQRARRRKVSSPR